MIRKNVNKTVTVFPNTELFTKEFTQEITVTGGTGGEVFRGDSVNNILYKSTLLGNEIAGLSVGTRGELNLDTPIQVESINIQGVSFTHRPKEMMSGKYSGGKSGGLPIGPGHYLGGSDDSLGLFYWYKIATPMPFQPYFSENPEIGLTFCGTDPTIRTNVTINGSNASQWACNSGNTNEVWKSFYEILYHPPYNKIIYVPLFIEQRTRISDLVFNYPQNLIHLGWQFRYPGIYVAGASGNVVLSQSALDRCNEVLQGTRHPGPTSGCPWCVCTRESWASVDATGGYVRTDHPAFVNVPPYTKTKELRFSSAIYNMDYENVRPTTKISDLCATDTLYPVKHGLEPPQGPFLWLQGLTGEKTRVMIKRGENWSPYTHVQKIPHSTIAKQNHRVSWPTPEIDLDRGWYWVAFLHGATGGPTYGDPLTAATASFGVHKGVFGDQFDPQGWAGYYNNSHTDPNILGMDYKAFTQKRRFDLHTDSFTNGKNNGYTNDYEFFYGVSVLALGSTYEFSETLPDHAGVSFSNEYRYPEFELHAAKSHDGTERQSNTEQPENYLANINRQSTLAFDIANAGLTQFGHYPQNLTDSVYGFGADLFALRTPHTLRDMPLLPPQREKLQKYFGSEFFHPTGTTNVIASTVAQKAAYRGLTFESGIAGTPAGGDISIDSLSDRRRGHSAETWPFYLPNYYDGTASGYLFKRALEEQGLTLFG